MASRQGLCDAVYTQSLSLAEVLRCHLQEPHSLFTDRVNFERTALDLERVTQQRSLRPGQRLFSVGEPSTELFIIESGTVDLQVLSTLVALSTAFSGACTLLVIIF